MRYQVPQFIEVEDKIFGPLTLRQFLYVAGAGAIGFILWAILPNFIAILIGIPIVLFLLSLAFYQYNSRPFIHTVEGAVKYFFSKKLYVWAKKEKQIENKKSGEDQNTNIAEGLMVPKLSDSKLKEISWSLDINEKIRN